MKNPHDISRKLINLNSLTEKNTNNPDGDIEIQIKGLRPGEKLYEEMLISDNSEKTENPLIFKAKEQFIEAKDLWPEIFISRLPKKLSRIIKILTYPYKLMSTYAIKNAEIISSISFKSCKSWEQSFIAFAASFDISEDLQTIDAHASGEATEYTEFSSIAE